MAEGKEPRKMNVRIVKSRDPQPVQKSDVSEQITPDEAYNAGEWLSQPLDLRGLKVMVNNSAILPQCIRAYKDNICGFGIGVKYHDDVEENEAAIKEYDRMTEILDLLCTEKDTKEVFEDVVEDRETYGTAYIEVIRNLAGEVVQIEHVKDTPSITKTQPLDPYMDVTVHYKGKEVVRKKRFCKYRQQLGGKTVYFKEMGDPRLMDKTTGEYISEAQGLERDKQANELLEFPIGEMPYGEVRWMGQILGIDGSRRAEVLNNNYFTNGRHTPMMIMIENGTITEESYEKLQEYMDDIKGESGQHAFILLEFESSEGKTDFDNNIQPNVQVKDLANVLQKDELFQDYIENHRRSVQSSFLLPDLYVGYTTDFNRATAQTAQEVTEKQVFQPERKSLAWTINNRLLGDYNFQYVEAYFLEPNITNPDDTYKMLTVLNNAGGLPMNKAKELTYKMYGETSEDYEADWGDLPLALARASTNSSVSAEQLGSLAEDVSKQINKAESAGETDEVVAVMREVRNLLKQMQADAQKGGAENVPELPKAD